VAKEIIGSLILVDDKAYNVQLEEIAHTTEPVSIGFLNQHAYNLMFKSNFIKSSFLDIDYMFRDGKGIELACKYHKIDPKKNLNGTDLIPQLINRLINTNDDINFFAYGTEEPWLSKGAESLFKTKKFHHINGFKSDKAYLGHYLGHHQPDKLNVVVLAMGMPKQERIAELIKKYATGRVIVICGGAIIDFQAGRVKRAPEFFRKIGMEWLYRLLREPKRLFVRYVIGIPVFFYNVYVPRKKEF